MSELPDSSIKQKLVAHMRPGRSGLKTFIKQKKQKLVKREIGDSDVDEPLPKKVKIEYKVTSEDQ